MLFMKHITKLFSLLLSVVLLINSFYITAFANITYDADTLYLSGATYSGKVNNLFSKPTYYEITIYSIYNNWGKYSGHLKTTGGQTIDQEISGNVDVLSRNNGYYKLEIDCIFSYNNDSRAFTLTLNDEDGSLSGSVNLSFMGLDSHFYGTSGVIKNALKYQNCSPEATDYNECISFDVDVYGKDNKTLKNEIIPKQLYNSLYDKKYIDIKPYNFHDDKDDNTSYVFAHKKVNKKEKLYVIIRGTDGVEWVGNMKICPPDESGNYDKYTFSDDKNTHYNFSQAEKELENNLRNYIKSNNLDSEKTDLIITGHSRGGAVSNLLAKELTDDTEFKPFVTAYTFATPNVATYDKKMENYENIFNFVRGNDFVPNIPLPNNNWNYWKYGKTYIETNTKYETYCDKITKIMSDEQYAPNVKEYYHKRYKNIYNNSETISLYNVLSNGLGNAMSSNTSKGIKYILNCFSYKGMGKLLSNVLIKIKKVNDGHSYNAYSEIGLSDYEPFNFYQMKVKLGEKADGVVTSLQNYATEYITHSSNNISYDLREIEQLKHFLQIKDENSISNLDKLGYNIDDYSTWHDIVFDEAGKVISINFEFKDLCGILNLTDFSNLKYLNISSNYINQVIIDNCHNLSDIDISDNNIKHIDIKTNYNICNLNCSNNKIGEIDLSSNTNLISLDVSNCLLTDIDITLLKNLEMFNCSFNRLSSLDIANNNKIYELSCIFNYIDLDNKTFMDILENIAQKENSNVFYELQYISNNAKFDTDEMQAIKDFAYQNSCLELLNNDSSLNIEKVQEYFNFDKFENTYKVTSIDISDENISGKLNCNCFKELQNINCNSSKLTSLDLTDCLKITSVNCSNCELTELLLPSNSSHKSSILKELLCDNNHLDINVFSNKVLNNIKSKNEYSLSYKHQIINKNKSQFNNDDYNILENIFNQNNNKNILKWDLNKPGEWNEITWKYDFETNKYYIYECDFKCLNLTGNIDLSKLSKIENLSFAGTNINSVILPNINVTTGSFYDCKYLEAVILQGGTTISSGAFMNCPALQAIYIPDSIADIFDDAFANSSKVTICANTGSFAEAFANKKGINFKSGSFLCGNIVAMESPNNIYEHYYPVEDVNISNEAGNISKSDKYGYFVVYSLKNGNYDFALDYKYGYNLHLKVKICDSSVVISTPITMICCDFNKDGYINAKDFAVLKKHINGYESTIDNKYFDINKDGIVDNDDWKIGKNFLLCKNNNEIIMSYSNAEYDIIPATAETVGNEEEKPNGIDVVDGGLD